MRNTAEADHYRRIALLQKLGQLRGRLPILFFQEEKTRYMIMRWPAGIRRAQIAADGIQGELWRIGVRVDWVLNRRQSVLRAKRIDDRTGCFPECRRLHASKVVGVN